MRPGWRRLFHQRRLGKPDANCLSSLKQPGRGTMNGTGRFALVRQLMASGINCMFGNPGSSEESILDVLRYEEFRSFQYYLAFQEGTAVTMADSYARATQRPAVVQL